MPVCNKKWNNSEYKIADDSDEMAEKGKNLVDLALTRMPVCAQLIDRFSKEKPFENITVAACLHVTKETANLCRALKAGGAEVYLCGSNPLSTQDEVAALLVSEGIHVYAWRGNTSEEFYECIDNCLVHNPNILIDDGADLIYTAHVKYPQYFEGDGPVIACQEETTTGVHRFEAMDKAGELKTALYPVNDAPCKNQFDNELGTGQGVVSAIIGMHILFAGKVVVVAGYGHCSSGMAQRARGLGARVIVTEIDPVKALKAAFDGFEVGKMDDVISKADMVFTATGNRDIVSKRHIDKLKDGVILANLGHFDVEIVAKDLYEAAEGRVREVRPNVEELIMPNGNRVYLLAQGRLANLAIAEGHPAEVMDMSFGLQGMMAEYIVKNKDKIKGKKGVFKVPDEINNAVAFAKLKAMGIEIDKLTPEQEAYMNSYKEGT